MVTSVSPHLREYVDTSACNIDDYKTKSLNQPCEPSLIAGPLFCAVLRSRQRSASCILGGCIFLFVINPWSLVNHNNSPLVSLSLSLSLSDDLLYAYAHWFQFEYIYIYKRSCKCINYRDDFDFKKRVNYIRFE